jgi:hypothetical protein
MLHSASLDEERTALDKAACRLAAASFIRPGTLRRFRSLMRGTPSCAAPEPALLAAAALVPRHSQMDQECGRWPTVWTCHRHSDGTCSATVSEDDGNGYDVWDVAHRRHAPTSALALASCAVLVHLVNRDGWERWSRWASGASQGRWDAYQAELLRGEENATRDPVLATAGIAMHKALGANQ